MSDFNQLLRESRRLEAAMDGSSSAGLHAGSRGGLQPTDSAAALPLSGLRGPPLTRSLAQLDVASAKLVRAQATAPTASADSQAQLLLAAKGIDVRKQARALKELQQAQPPRGAAVSGGAGPLPIDSFHPLDIDGYLHHQQQLLCHRAMEDAARVTGETFRRRELSCLDEDWASTKRDMIDGMGFRAGRNAIAQAAGEAAMQQAQQREEAGKRRAGAINTAQQYNAQSAMVGPVLGMEQAIYARSVHELNRARVRRTPVPLLGLLRGAAAAVDDFFQRQSGGGEQPTAAANGLAVGDVTDCWDVLRCLLQQGRDESGDGAAPLVEKAFASAYDAPSSAPDSIRLRQQLIRGAKSYSEGLFAAYIKRVVEAHPEARRGGGAHYARAPFARQAASYVAVLADRLPNPCHDMQLDGLPLWPQVYYCFRCGHLADALLLLQTASDQSGGLGGRSGGGLGAASGGHYEQLTRTFVDCMERRAQQQDGALLPAALWQSLYEEFQREIRSAINSARAQGASSSQAGLFLDPFKLALYHLLGRFRLPSELIDLSALVAPTTEDYLWLKLSLLCEGGASAAFDSTAVPDTLRDHVDGTSLRLASLQSDLLQRGEGAFNPDGRHPLAYFKVLLLSLQFEQAVYFLIKTVHFTVGVHFAIALDYAGCLRVHSNSKQELLVGVSPAGAPGSGVPATYALNYSRVLRKYVESFVRSHPFEAFHYLYLMHPQSAAAAHSASSRGRGLGNSNGSFSLLAGADDISVAESDVSDSASDPSFSALRDLLLETREFDLLVGSIVPAGAHSGAHSNGASSADSIQTARGLLYNYLSAAEASALLVSTGHVLSQHGLALDAMHVYLLAFQFDLAVELALKTLSPLVSAPLQSDERQAVVAAAQRVQRVVSTQQEAGQSDRSRAPGGDASGASVSALHRLLSLVSYFDHYHLGPDMYADALRVLQSSDVCLLPTQASDAHAFAAAFGNTQQTHPSLQRTIANVAVSCMDIYYVQYQLAKRDMNMPALYQPQQAQREQIKQQRLTHLRAQAHALTSFIGLIQKHEQISADVYAKIFAVEAMMAP